MLCKSGIFVTSRDQFVPCGQCMACRVNAKRKWAGRIMMEWMIHEENRPGHSWFVTLTYNPEHLPEDGNLDKPGIRQWLKDVQKRKTDPFRYYLVGEYGGKHRRPHYHLAVFAEHNAQIRVLLDEWRPKGFVEASEITPARAGYLANYTTKKLTAGRCPEGLAPEFRTSSRYPPLGQAFVERVIAAYQTRAGKAVIAERGDIERTFRCGGRIYPFDGWALGQIRKSLEIPATEAERRLHPNYDHYHQQELAECDHEEADNQRRFIDAKAKAGFNRGKGRKIT